jgi:hypothetical protein
MRARKGFRASAVDRRADVEHHHGGIVAMRGQPVHRYERGDVGAGGRGRADGERRGGGEDLGDRGQAGNQHAHG